MIVRITQGPIITIIQDAVGLRKINEFVYIERPGGQFFTAQPDSVVVGRLNT